MPGVDIGPRIGIDGEKEFRSQINGIITEMKTLSSEMRLVTSEFEDNEQSTESLTRKNQVLEKQIDAQTRKLELLRKGLDESAKKFGEADAKTLKWKQAVNYAQIDLNKFERELSENKQKLSDLENGLDSAGDSLVEIGNGAEGAAGGFTVMKGAMADLVSEGIQEVISGAKEMATEYIDATTKMQGQTGATAKEMERYKDVMDDIYSGGYGDNIEGVADALSKVRQQMGDLDDDSLRRMTESALNLEQTFDFDVSESIRTVKQLMNQFGISSEEAFDLIVSGAQNGLNQNDNLLDTLNEYSPKFAEIGLGADDMYNALRSGADQGIFDIDKLGDAVNEFSIRVVDGSDTTKDAFKRLGLDAEEMEKAFASGGDTARDAFKKTMRALRDLEDPLDQNTAGVELFGTMWEDTGGEAILALGDIESGVDDVEGSMKRLDKVNADSLTNKFSTLGRTIQSDVVQPILEDAYPAIEDFVEFTADNLDEIIAIAKPAGAAIVGIFAVDKASAFVGTVTQSITALKGMLTATEGVNAAMKVSPIGLVTTAVIGLTAAASAYNGVLEVQAEKEYGLTDAENDQIKTHEELYNTYSQVHSAREEAVNDITSEFAYYDKLIKELQNITDENGKVKAGYEDRAQYIIGVIEKQTGSEIEMTDGVIQKYGDLMDTIDEVMNKKKAEAILSAMNDEYATAIQKQAGAYKAYSEDLELAKEKKQDLQKAEEKFNSAIEVYTEKLTSGQNATWYYATTVKGLEKDLEAAREAEKKASDQMEKSEEAYVGYNQTIQSYEGLSSAVVAGDADAINEKLIEVQNGFITAENSTRESLVRQVENMKQNYQDLKTAIEQNAPYVTQEMVDNAKLMVNKADAELDKFDDMAAKRGNEGASDFANAVGSQNSQNQAGIAGAAVANAANNALNSIDTYSTGNAKSGQYASGVSSGSGSAYNSGASVAGSAVSGLSQGSGYGIGQSLTQGYINGISSLSGAAGRAAANVVANAVARMRAAQNSHSPSKVTYGLGEDYDQGYINAILDGSKKAEEASSKLVKSAVDAMRSPAYDLPDLSGYRKGGVIYNVTKVYLGDKELVNELSGGVVKRIGYQQKSTMAAKGRRA